MRYCALIEATLTASKLFHSDPCDKVRARFAETVKCSFCARNQDETVCMIGKGDDLFICRECVIEGIKELTEKKPVRRPTSSTRKVILASQLGVDRSFCERKGREVRAVAAPNPALSLRVCDECLMISFDIMLRNSFGKRIGSKTAIFFLVHRDP